MRSGRDDFAARLAQAVAAAGVTQAQLARRCGVSAASVSDWMRGVTGADHVKAAPLLRAAAYLGVPAEWLLFGTGRAPGAGAPPVAREPEAVYDAGWPFSSIDRRRIVALPEPDRLRLKGAWLLVARQLGVDVAASD